MFSALGAIRRHPERVWVTLVFNVVLLCSSALSQNFTGGYQFSLPWADSSYTPAMPYFPPTPIGPGDFVSISGDGHFLVRGTPTRFFGTNCVADGAFPGKSIADAVAGRLRKFGYNLIRLHHMDNNWTATGSLFGGQPDTRHLNAGVLDRLDYFIGALKRQGIRADVNLNVGRTFTKADGVPEADSLPDFAKGCTLFDPILIALEKEYAEQLLTHVNPYTGLSLVNDPAMAVIEVTNENSIFASWRNNRLKPYVAGGTLPVRQARLLDSLWNAYLLGKYGSTPALAASWNSGSRSEGTESVLDGSFENSAIPGPWVLEQHAPAAAVAVRTTAKAYSGLVCAQVTVSAGDGTDWHVQFKQPTLSMVKDSTYIIRFALRADSMRTVSFSVMQEGSPYTWYGGTSVVADTSWNATTFSFVAPATRSGDLRLSFGLGAAAGVYWFDDVSMKLSPRNGLLPGESLETSTPRRLDYGECVSFTDARVRDMTAFYMDLQQRFFQAMAGFLHGSLGVRVPVVGTNWNFGVADIASQSAAADYVDNHSYWDHPSFPGIPWSSTDWTMENTPMVYQTDGATVGRLMAGTAMTGKPYTVSEYNHPFPNRYNSEGPLFLTAYALFHDADAIMFFDYNGGTDWAGDFIPSYFDMGRNTAQMALMPSLALAFRSGLIAPAKQVLELQFTPDDVLLAPKHDNGGWQGSFPISTTVPLVHEVRTKTFQAGASNIAGLNIPPAAPFVSDTRELTWDPLRGYLAAGASRFTSVTGVFPSAGSVQAGDMTLESSSDHATLTWVSIDSMALVDSRKSLLTIATRVQNTGMIWDGTRTLHDNWGTAPTTVMPVNVSVRLHLRADSIRVTPLTTLGTEGMQSFVVLPGDTNSFVVNLNQSQFGTPWFSVAAFGRGALTGVPPKPDVPASFALYQNYPNPFNPATTIRYAIPRRSRVRLTVFNTLGQQVARIVDGDEEPGYHDVHFDGTGLASGVYICRFQAGDVSQARKLVLSK
jgi:hypothetical protein